MFAAAIAKWRAEIQAKQERITALLALSVAESRCLTAPEVSEHDVLSSEIVEANAQVARLVTASAQAVTAATVTAAVAADGLTPVTANRGITIINRKTHDDKFAGQSFTRMAIAKVVGKMDGVPAHIVAQNRWPERPELADILAKRAGYRAADLAGGGTVSPAFGFELVSTDNRYTGDFIEFLYSQTIFDRLPLFPVPANVSIKGQDGASTGYWVGAGKGIPMTNMSTSTVALTALKVAALTVVSKELLRQSSPSAEMIVRNSLVESSAQRVDTTFLSTTAASALVSPAGIFNGVSPGSTNGPYDFGAIADIQSLVEYFVTNKNSGGLVWVMNKTLALALSMLRFSQGQVVFPTITPEGGTLANMPVYTGDNVAAGTLALIKPGDIWKIDDTGLTVDLSTEATIEMADNPSGSIVTPTDLSQAPVNMFQTDSVAIKVVRGINYQKRRSISVAFIDDADYSNNTTA